MPRKRQKTPKNDFERLARKLAAAAPDQQPTLQHNLLAVKMSEVLQEFVQPYFPVKMTLAIYEKIVVTGIMAWNIACMPPTEEKAAIQKIVQAVEEGERSRENLQWMLEALIARKRQRYDANKRRIVQYQVSATADQFNLSVVSTPE